MEDKIIWYGIGLNILTLIIMTIYALSIGDDYKVWDTLSLDNYWDTLKIMWWLSFGWICGRLSNG